jgi:predicted acyl esterase
MREDAVWIPTSDGVRLDASVCLPDGDAPAGGWPGVLLVHGHGEDGSKASTLERARRCAARGRIALAYSVRGQGASEGLSFHLGAREIFDLQEVVAAFRERFPVRADRIAVAGSSQGGWHAFMAAAFTDVRCVVPENIFVDYGAFAVPHGALSTWFFTKTMRRRVMSAGLQDQARRWAKDREWDRLVANLRPFSPRVYASRMQCPMLVVHGWHDQGMPANDHFRMLDEVRGRHWCLVGGGGHEGQDGVGPQLLREETIEAFLSHFLEGAGPAPGARIRAAVRPTWEHADTERFEPDAETRLHLRADGTLDPLAPTVPTPNSNLNHQPRDPAYTLGVALDRDLQGSDAAWPREERAFDGAPLEAPLVLRGIPRFELHVLPERPWFQIHAELWDVAPDGTQALVSRGHLGEWRAVPGIHRRIEIEGRAIAWRIAAGHRLRVTVADQAISSVLPEYRPWRARLYHEADRASAVVLPVSTP